MDQHAVPQDITGFKFKLVGDMTVKQFGELAGGAIVAYLFYATNWHPILKYPFVAFFALFGVALAFLPIQERPLDIWVINFFKAIYRPTYYTWQKQDSQPTKPVQTQKSSSETIPLNNRATVPNQPVMTFTPLTTLQKPTQTQEEKTQTEQFNPLNSQSQPEKNTEENVSVPMPVSQTPTINPSPTADTVERPGPQPVVDQMPQATVPVFSVHELEKLRLQRIKDLEVAKEQQKTAEEEAKEAAKEAAYQASQQTNFMTIDALEQMRKHRTVQKDTEHLNTISKAEAEINDLLNQNKNLIIQIEQLKSQITDSGSLTSEAQKKLSDLTTQKTKLMEEVQKMRAEVTQKRIEPLKNPAYEEYTAENKASVRVVQKPVSHPATITLTDIPNVINGLVVDEKNNPLDGVIIIVKDQGGNSIRALKTSRIGQFIGSTPLENGTYFLEMEKQNYSFDVLEITLTGEKIKPIEVKAKQNMVQTPATV